MTWFWPASYDNPSFCSWRVLSNIFILPAFERGCNKLFFLSLLIQQEIITSCDLNFYLKRLFSFVRSVTMDKWKDIELEKMKAGGNSKFREFLESQDDYDPCWSMQEKYNSKAAALFRDQVGSVGCVLIPHHLKIPEDFVSPYFWSGGVGK